MDFTGFIREVVTDIFMRIFNVAFQLGKKLKGRRDFFLAWHRLTRLWRARQSIDSNVVGFCERCCCCRWAYLISGISGIDQLGTPSAARVVCQMWGHQRFVDFPFAAHWACHMAFITQGVKGGAILKPRIEVVFVGTA